MKLHRILLPLLLLLLKGGTAAVEPGAQVPPDPQFQARIAAVVNAMVRKKEAVQERLEQLDEIAKARREKLLQQLALYLSRSGGTEESMGGALLLRHFQFTPDEKLEAVLPCLESRDPLLRK
ncbi:MAG: hypothetical protein ACE5ID_09420, partial [Acidobacteriota bacterium]